MTSTPDGIERVLAAIEPGDTLIDRHPHGDEIRALLVDYALESPGVRPSLTLLAKDIEDRYAQDGSLGANVTQTLRYYLDTRIADKIILSASWMAQGAMKAGADLNLLRQQAETLKQHEKSLAIIDKAIERAQERVEASEEGEGMGNLDTLLQRRESALARKEATLKAMLDLQLTLGLIEDKRVSKSMTLNVNADGRPDPKEIMQNHRRKPIDATAKIVDP